MECVLNQYLRAWLVSSPVRSAHDEEEGRGASRFFGQRYCGELPRGSWGLSASVTGSFFPPAQKSVLRSFLQRATGRYLLQVLTH